MAGRVSPAAVLHGLEARYRVIQQELNHINEQMLELQTRKDRVQEAMTITGNRIHNVKMNMTVECTSAFLTATT